MLNSESGGVNIGPRKVRGSSASSYGNLNIEGLLERMGQLDMDKINNNSFARNRRSLDNFTFWGPVVCFVSFLVASVFMVRVRSARNYPLRKNRALKRKSNRNKTGSKLNPSSDSEVDHCDNRAEYTMV